jgi:heme oxygenase
LTAAIRADEGVFVVDEVLAPALPAMPAGTGSAAALREATLQEHRETERAAFVVDLMAGRLGIAALARLTGQLRAVYAAMEIGVEPYRDDPLLGRLFDPRLDRLAAIDHDLAELAGAAAAGLTVPLPETLAYVDRIRAVSDSGPRLVAHHYVRYLGDLSGGQIIADRLRRHYGLPSRALTFYAFHGLGSKGGFKAVYRGLLDELLADPGTYGTVVDEAQLAYRANGRLFAALGRLEP